MNWKVSHEPLGSLIADAAVVFIDDAGGLMEGDRLDEELRSQISQLVHDREIKGRLGEVTVLHQWNNKPVSKVLIAGLGKADCADLSKVRHAVAVAARKAASIGVKSLGILCPSYLTKNDNAADVIQFIVEGVELGTYQHHSYKSEQNRHTLETIWLISNGIRKEAVQVGLERGQVFARASNFARFLTHEPANRLTPETFVEQIDQLAERRSLTVEVKKKAELEELGMHALLAVSQGSRYEPVMVTLSYRGAPDQDEVLGFVGKGITYDSGGIQLKKELLDIMKIDMAGAAAVLGAMDAIGALRPYINVLAVIPICENMIDGKAYHPGDVIDTFAGYTVEITHTDAEGRLILADGLAYAKSLGATKLIDVATLTGAVYTTFGNEASALMTNHVDWGQEVLQAAKVVGERIWELPMYEEYEQLMESDLADIKNFGGMGAISIQGGVFLQKFVGDTPWVHLDVTGTVISPRERGVFVKGATGSPVRTLIQLAVPSC